MIRGTGLVVFSLSLALSPLPHTREHVQLKNVFGELLFWSHISLLVILLSKMPVKTVLFNTYFQIDIERAKSAVIPGWSLSHHPMTSNHRSSVST